MLQRILFLSGFLFVCFVNVVLGEEPQPNLKFGEPTNEELTMTSYSKDEAASAVVLCYLTDVNYEILNGDFRLKTDVKVRVKVLKSDGKDIATVAIPYREYPVGRERITGLKATAFNMENGKVVKTKMTSDMETTEQVDENHFLRKFTVPQVKAGTVFEYQYSVVSELYYTIRTWYAQMSVPVIYARYAMSIPEYFKFSLEESGTNDIVSTKKLGTATFPIQGELLSVNTDEYTFEGHHMPALRSDDYVWAEKDYCNKVEAELRGLVFPGALYKDFTNTWENIDKELMDADGFGRRIKRSNPLRDEQLASKVNDIEDVCERAAAVFLLMRKHLAWNGEYKLLGRSVAAVMKDRFGSNADLNFILLNMLSDAGVKAFPVVMSARDYGRIPLTHPSIESLSTFVVGFMVDDTKMAFLDASCQDGYINVLPPVLLTNQARAIYGNGQDQWVNLQALPGAKKQVKYEASVGEDGTMNVHRKRILSGPVAASLRKDYRLCKDSTDYVRKISESLHADVVACHLKGHRSFSNLVEEDIDYKAATMVAGDLIYLNPFVAAPIDKNPFTAETRKMPVEFPYKSLIVQNSRITIPEGFVVEEMPLPLKMQSDDKSLLCTVNISQEGNQIVSMFRFEVRKMFFSAEEYTQLKQFFDKLLQKSSENIVLKKQ